MDNLKVQSPKEAQAIIMKKLRAGYGPKAKVKFLKTMLETDLANGRRLWVVEGDIKVRRWFFLKKSWHFTYFLSAEDGKVLIMRGRKAKTV
ncbi:hypothetical protein CW704_01495 [Candidatus Bathyarchaeota archaeon]|nr:MAG: hypothetical protein CW704_01495 [Candidatus Bathyarchaeota archaeon]